MRIRKLYGIALVLVLMLGIAGCGLFDSRDPVGPVNSLTDSNQLGNFWVKDGPGGKYEVSTKEGEMEVSVPSEGQYMLTYTSMYGTFYIVFATQDAATLVIGLQPGDTVETAFLQDGEILDVETLQIIVQTDILIAYLLPGTEDEGENEGEEEGEEDADDAIASEWYEMFDGGFLLIMLIINGEVVLEETEGDDDEDAEDGSGKWEVTVSAEGNGSVKPGGTKMVPDGASISIQFLPESGNFADISVKIITLDELGEKVEEEDFTPYLQQLGGKPGKQKGHLVIHDVDQDLNVVATFE